MLIFVLQGFISKEENYKVKESREKRGKWRRERQESEEKKVEKAMIDPAAEAPCQPACWNVSRSDHSASSKESTS